MAFTYLTSGAASVSDANHAVTGSLNTSGGDFAAVAFGFALGATPVITDSKSNTWTTRTVYSNSFGSIAIAYSNLTSVGTGHTFTVTGAGLNPNLAVAIFSGALLATPFDQENGQGIDGVSTIQPGSVTPSLANELVIAACVDASSPTIDSVDGGFTKVGGTGSIPTALGYLIQSAAVAANPTWTLASAGNPAASIATFKTNGAVPSAGSFFMVIP